MIFCDKLKSFSTLLFKIHQGAEKLFEHLGLWEQSIGENIES